MCFFVRISLVVEVKFILLPYTSCRSNINDVLAFMKSTTSQLVLNSCTGFRNRSCFVYDIIVFL